MRSILSATILILGLTGCANCDHRSYDRALEESRCPEIPAAARMNTYAILIKGLDPLDLAAVDALRETLIERGYPKVFRIEALHAGYIAREVDRIRCERPDARFVLVGTGTGAIMARALSGSLAQAGATVDAVVEIAPIHSSLIGGLFSVQPGHRHVVIGRVGMGAYSPDTRTEYRIVTGLGRLSPCAHPLVQEMVIEQLEISSRSQELIDYGSSPHIPLIDQPAPAPGELLQAYLMEK